MSSLEINNLVIFSIGEKLFSKHLNMLMARWFILAYLTGKEVVKLASVSKDMRNKIMSENDYKKIDQGNIDRCFKK